MIRESVIEATHFVNRSSGESHMTEKYMTCVPLLSFFVANFGVTKTGAETGCCACVQDLGLTFEAQSGRS